MSPVYSSLVEEEVEGRSKSDFLWRSSWEAGERSLVSNIESPAPLPLLLELPGPSSALEMDSITSETAKRPERKKNRNKKIKRTKWDLPQIPRLLCTKMQVERTFLESGFSFPSKNKLKAVLLSTERNGAIFFSRTTGQLVQTCFSRLQCIPFKF